MIHFHVNLDPVSKLRARFTSGRTYTPTKTKLFERDFKLLASQYKPKTPLKGPLEVVVIFQIKKPKSVRRETPSVKPDVDNFVKAVFDAMNGDFWLDDAQVVYLVARKRYGCFGFINVAVKEIDEQDCSETYPASIPLSNCPFHRGVG